MKNDQFLQLRKLEEDRWSYVFKKGYAKKKPLLEIWELDLDKKIIKEIVNRKSDLKLLEMSKNIKSLKEGLLTSNRGLVFSIVDRKLERPIGIVSKQDLITVGLIGLMKAIDRFDAHRGIRFSTYASYWIRNEIFKEIKDNGSTVRFPHNVEGIADILSLDVSVFKNDKEEKFTYKDLLPTEDRENLFDNFGFSWDELKYAFFKLSNLEKCILEQRFIKDRSLKSVGEDYGLSRERIRQLQNAALEKMKMFLYERKNERLGLTGTDSY